MGLVKLYVEVERIVWTVILTAKIDFSEVVKQMYMICAGGRAIVSSVKQSAVIIIHLYRQKFWGYKRATQLHSSLSARWCWILAKAIVEWRKCTENMRAHWLVFWMESSTSARKSADVSMGSVGISMVYCGISHPMTFSFLVHRKWHWSVAVFTRAAKSCIMFQNRFRYQRNDFYERSIHHLMKNWDKTLWSYKIMFQTIYVISYCGSCSAFI